MIESIILCSSVASLVAFNLYATYRCYKSEYSERIQKLFQTLFIWVVPIVGGFVVIHFSKPDPVGGNYKTSDAAPAADSYPVDLGHSKSSSDGGGSE